MNNLEKAKSIFLQAKNLAGTSSQVEIFLSSVKSSSIVWSERRLEDYRMSSSTGVGIKLIKSCRQGCAYTSDFSDSSIKNLVDSAIRNIELIEPDPFYSIASPEITDSSLDVCDDVFGKKSVQEHIKTLQETEKSVLADKKIKSVLDAHYSETYGETCLVNSNDICLSARGTAFSFGISLVAEYLGDTQTGGEYAVKRIASDIDIELTTSMAVKNAVGLLGAKLVKTGRYDVILDPAVSCDFLMLLVPSFSAYSVQKNVSLLAGKIGQKVCSDLITLTDDGTLKNGVSTASFDDEGTPTRRNPLIEKGILKTYLYDRYTAARDKRKSTGNASRGYSGFSVPSATNIYFSSGASDFDGLLKNMGTGIYITETLGMHNADPVSGEFSVGANGFFVESGCIKYPVHGITIAGNVLNFFENVSGVGREVKFYGSIGCPALLIKNLSVAGE
ncbi:MAG: peptidase PmbA [Elusimicrobia bacterium ADurb.Bin231]|nr:MAG: peptidase PmbA [Elusimicrobia bacterium ADurb.Bin231]